MAAALSDPVAAVAERSQVAVALTAEARVGAVVNLEPVCAAALAASAGPCDRARPLCTPVG